MSLDPTQPPPRNVALTLAQAALQRQTQLLEALGGQAATQEAEGAKSNTPAPSVPHPAPDTATDATLPNETGTRHGQSSASSAVPVRLSEPARAQLAQAELAALPLSAPAASNKNAAVVPPPWPVAVTDEPTLALLDTLLQTAPTSGVASSKLLGVQPWPPALVQQLINAGTDTPEEAQPAPWQTWPLPASMVQTALGRQTLQATLVMPATGQPVPTDPAEGAHPGLPENANTLLTPGATLPLQLPPGTASPMATTPRLLLMPQQTTPLTSAWFAVLLETESGEHHNALLALEFGAPQAAALYGRDLFTPRSDPWQQQAVLLASSQVPRVAARPGDNNAHPTCQTTNCPYHGRAVCPQPFCPDALRVRSV